MNTHFRLRIQGIMKKKSFNAPEAANEEDLLEVPQDWEEPGPVSKEENPSGMVAETAFATIFPKYR